MESFERIIDEIVFETVRKYTTAPGTVSIPGLRYALNQLAKAVEGKKDETLRSEKS